MNHLIEAFVKESLKFQLLDYLYRNKEFSIVQLTTKFMISESSLFRKIKELNQLLAAFDLQIKMDNYREKNCRFVTFTFSCIGILLPMKHTRKNDVPVK